MLNMQFVIDSAKDARLEVDILGTDILINVEHIDVKILDLISMIQQEAIYTDHFDDMTVYSLENIKVGLIYE